VPVVPLYSELERPEPPRAAACSQIMSEKIIFTLHDICSALGNDLIKCLQAVNGLTECDTTSKIATKYAALSTIKKPGNSSHLLDFKSTQLTESILEMAEKVLVNCLKDRPGDI